ncbi:DsbA family protein [Roseomonas sp. CCTCC AB2023176]|uniref:DsbA family protein n=1 Tax=Roseomonas sp. CCTCC AB2023176 TaxID=3342640 RepID=UPI0035D646C2
MTLPRRTLLLASGALALPLALPMGIRPAAAQAPAPATIDPNDPRRAERSAGKADAPATVIEYFSMTCGHCAQFHREVWPRVKSELVETGKVRMVWRDFPLDQLAVAAHAIARALPPERYEAFVGALLASQDRWAFAQGADRLGEIAKVAAVAGMSRQQVEAAATDRGLQQIVLENRLQAEREHRVNSTPTFVFGSRTQPGSVSFERFKELAGV